MRGGRWSHADGITWVLVVRHDIDLGAVVCKAVRGDNSNTTPQGCRGSHAGRGGNSTRRHKAVEGATPVLHCPKGCAWGQLQHEATRLSWEPRRAWGQLLHDATRHRGSHADTASPLKAVILCPARHCPARLCVGTTPTRRHKAVEGATPGVGTTPTGRHKAVEGATPVMHRPGGLGCMHQGDQHRSHDGGHPHSTQAGPSLSCRVGGWNKICSSGKVATGKHRFV